MGAKLEIRCEYDAAAVGFINTLPNARSNRGSKTWSCMATPLAAWKLRDTGLTLDAAASYLAQQWDRAIAPPVKGSVNTALLKTKPRPHQIAAMEFAAHKPGSLMAIGMGGGKSLTAIGLMTHWQCRKVIVLCPKAVLGVWRREMEKHCGLSHQVAVLDVGTSKQKREQAELALARASQFAVTMVVVNYESSWRSPLCDVLGKEDWDLFIADESHKCCDPRSQQSRLAQQVSKNSTHRVLLTGTPFDSPLGLFGQYLLLEPAIFGTSFSRFRSQYAVCHEQYKNKVLRLINQDDFIAKYRELAFRVETLDVWDLPPLTHTVIPVTLEPKTMKAYQTMAKQCLLEVEQGEVTASNAGVKLIRLATMACGHLKTDEGKTVRIGSEKKETLKEFISDIPKDEPVVVFCRFTDDLRQVAEVAAELKRTYGEVSGSRKDLTEHATMRPETQILGVQERAGGVGIDLTRARFAVFFSHGYSLKDTEQAYARLHRPGATKPVFIYHLVAERTIDTAVMKALENKADVVGEVLKHIKWSGK